MIKGAKRALCLLSAAAIMTLTGCGAGDDAYKRNTIETVKAATRAEYRTTTAKVGDIIMKETVRVEYYAARQEDLKFGMSGLYYDNISASVGDEVKAGDTLATLECTEIDKDIASFKVQRENLETEIERNQELLALLDKRGSADEELKHGYEVAIRDALDECAVVDAELQRLEELRAGRVITAGIDGIVTFVREISPGETSVQGRIVLKVTDLDSCIFTTTVNYPDAVDKDAIYTVTVDGEDYDIALASAEELGIEVEPLSEMSTRTQLFFRLLTPTANLASGDGGKFSVVVDSREDVLYIPSKALTTVDGVPSVYVPDENGLATVLNVEVGLNTGTYVEILGGLEEGDVVILY